VPDMTELSANPHALVAAAAGALVQGIAVLAGSLNGRPSLGSCGTRGEKGDSDFLTPFVVRVWVQASIKGGRAGARVFRGFSRTCAEFGERQQAGAKWNVALSLSLSLLLPTAPETLDYVATAFAATLPTCRLVEAVLADCSEPIHDVCS